MSSVPGGVHTVTTQTIRCRFVGTTQVKKVVSTPCNVARVAAHFRVLHARRISIVYGACSRVALVARFRVHNTTRHDTCGAFLLCTAHLAARVALVARFRLHVTRVVRYGYDDYEFVTVRVSYEYVAHRLARVHARLLLRVGKVRVRQHELQ